jgi:hypothetical protein
VPLANLPRLAVGAYLGRKRWGVPDFLYAALDVTAYAAFFKESRLKCAGATKLHRESGVAPTIALAEFPTPTGTIPCEIDSQYAFPSGYKSDLSDRLRSSCVAD